jgi:multiple sugar transport system substrate-binding protein
VRLHSRARPRRFMTLAAAISATALVLAACGSDDDAEPADAADDETADAGDEDAGDEPEEVEIRFSWWGSDSRHEQTQEIIDLFEAEYPHISVVPDFTDWDSYWERLATSTAGDDAPDVMTQEERFMTDYALRGQLLDLNELSVDLSSIDPLALAGGVIDGAQYAVATGVNAFTVVADPQAFEDAGVDMPDDTTWTWQDFADIAAELTASSEVFGVQPEGSNEAGLNIYARQRGEALYNPDGTLGFSAQTLADWWQIQLDLIDAGSAPPATELLEVEGPDTSFIATNQSAMATAYWTNQLGALSGTAGRDLVLLRYPGEFESDQPGMYLKPAMFYSISSQTEHPEEAALLVDFLLNSQAAAEIQLTDRGLPANLDIREAILPLLPETETQVSEFMAEITPDLATPPPPPPNGAGEVPAIFTRLWEEVLFEQRTPLEAAEQFITEATEATSG